MQFHDSIGSIMKYFLFYYQQNFSTNNFRQWTGSGHWLAPLTVMTGVPQAFGVKCCGRIRIAESWKSHVLLHTIRIDEPCIVFGGGYRQFAGTSTYKP